MSNVEPVLNGNPSLIETLSIPLNKDHCEVASKKRETPKKKVQIFLMGVFF
jgi:hypothetical protein